VKKILLVLLALCLFALILIYTLIPSQIKINKAMIVNASMASVSRSLMIEAGWNKWFDTKSKSLELRRNGLVFTDFKCISPNNGAITIHNGSTTQINSLISLTNLTVDSTIINWSCSLETSINPFKRWMYYQQAKKIKANLDEISSDFKKYIENFKLVYGFDIRKTKLMDSSMIAIKASVNNYPTLQDIYSKIEILEKYASSNNASPTDFPMLNIFKTDSNAYNFMVALPINKPLSATGEILYKQMLPKGNFVATDSIYGGFGKLDNLFASFIKMKEDYQMMSPAIPFQSLITDRRKETDTTKWVTRFYYPIF
jgi:hypothetical protein